MIQKNLFDFEKKKKRLIKSQFVTVVGRDSMDRPVLDVDGNRYTAVGIVELT